MTTYNEAAERQDQLIYAGIAVLGLVSIWLALHPPHRRWLRAISLLMAAAALLAGLFFAFLCLVASGLNGDSPLSVWLIFGLTVAGSGAAALIRSAAAPRPTGPLSPPPDQLS